MTKARTRRDIHQEITDQVIAALEAGTKPWTCPWDRSGSTALPINLASNKHYRGINVLVLWMTAAKQGFSSPYWCTYKQAKAAGGNVKKGEKATTGVFYKPLEKEDKDTGEIKKFAMLRSFPLFNLDQCEGIEAPSAEDREPRAGFDPIDNAERVCNGMGVEIRESGGQAYYRPSIDVINMPDRDRFDEAGDWYATLTHELAHSTGHKSRLDRDLSGGFGTPKYAFEELVAELASSFMCSELGIEGEMQHESYIVHWLEKLASDKTFIFKAAAQAAKAHEFIMQKAGFASADGEQDEAKAA